jgi:RND family efflux transporter MFP subunit
VKREVRKLLAAATALAALASVGLLVVRGKPAGNAAPAAPEPVLEFQASDLHVVRPEALERTLALTGTLSPFTSATLKAKVAGELVEVTAREGEPVRQGQVLARIDPTEVRARVAAREADVEGARAQLVWAEKNRATQKALLEKRFISQNAFDSVQSSHDVAVAKLRAAEAELLLAHKSLGDAVLTAPFSGIAAQRHAQPGERVALDAKVITIVDLARLELAASLPASAIAQVRVGQPVTFRVEGLGERPFAGRVERINPATESGSRAITVYAVMDNPEGGLRGGMFAQGAVLVGRTEGALAIPASAVREEAGQSFVYALVDGRVRRKAVKTAPGDGAARLQVLEGLAAGESIVRTNLGTLREGAAARLVPARAL